MGEQKVCSECAVICCRKRFEEFLVLEFTDAGYGVVHHLTVAAYMLQHSSRLTREGWLQERKLLREFLVENKPPQFICRQNRDLIDSGKRAFKIKSRDAQRVIHRSAWAKTIQDVRPENAETYCTDAIAWARSVLEDVQEISLEGGKNETE
jgi:Family of unknown function (DUF5946)